MSNLRIGVDLDGVLAEPMTVWCDLYNKRYSKSLSIDDIHAWEVWNIVRVSRDEFFRTLDDAWLEWQRIPATEEDIGQQFNLLREFGTVDVVTGRSVRTTEPAKEWLKAHSIQYDKFVRTESTLAKIHLDYDVFVDDSPRLMELIASKSIALGIIYTRPWNRDAHLSPVIRRVTKWHEIPSLVRTTSKKQTSRFGFKSF